MDPLSRIEAQRRFIQQRAQELLARVELMDEEELRWTVRKFADCLSPDERAAHLGSYSEHWDVARLRRFLPTFIQEYTVIALRDLMAKEGAQGTRLADLTEEELQSMSLAEKCYLLAADPEGLRTDQLCRELARLFMCKSFDLFHDTGLSEAAVEFPAYHRIREALETHPPATIQALRQMILERAGRLGDGPPDEVEAALAEIRSAIGQSLGLQIPADQLFAGQMLKLPMERPGEVPAVGSPGMADTPAEMPAEDLATAFLVVADLMSLREWEEHILPLQRQYRSITEIPPETLRPFLGRLAGQMGDRRITDFAERYRSGRMVAERKVGPEIWALLSFEERLAILERDNRTMDSAQAARHLVKIFFSFQYDMLFDAGFQVDLLRSPRYQRLVNRLIGGGDAGRVAGELTQTVTRRMLALEIMPVEARAPGLQAIRTLIASVLGLPDDLTYPAAKEGSA